MESFCVSFFSQNDRSEEGTVDDTTSIRIYSTICLSIVTECEDPNVDFCSESMNNVFDLPFKSTWNSAQTNEINRSW